MSYEPLNTRSYSGEFAERVGGKAAKLVELERLGCAVPEWFCLPVEAFDASLAEAVRRAGGEMERAAPPGVESLPVPNEVAAVVRSALEQHGLTESFVAVRSSGLDEDGSDFSFAGQFESFLFRRGAEDVLDAVSRCWASAFSERNIAYRGAVGAEYRPPRMGVIVQRMIDSESAGVAFSRNPLDPSDRDTLVIESVWGQGEGIVSGALDADRFTVCRSTLDTTSAVAQKSTAIVQAPAGGTWIQDVDADRVGQPSLSQNRVEEIATLVLRLEEALGVPQDVEWAYAGGQLYALQTRPITTLPPDAVFDPAVVGSDVVIWDNSNIIESYAGVTTPLTFSHVSRAYREVYYLTSRLMGVPADVVEARETMYRNMLGLVRGRIYYNLLNWYRLLALFPLVGKSGSFMETMMGVKQSLSGDLQPAFDRVVEEAPDHAWWQRYALLGRLGIRMLGGARANRLFLERVERVCRPVEEADLDTLSLAEQIALYHQLEDDVLRHWTAPIVNDTRCMIAFGNLKSRTEQWIATGPDDDAASLQNDLLCGDGDLKSTEPMRRLLDIAGRIDEDPQLRDRFVSEDAEDLWQSMDDGLAPEIRERFESYIAEYGYRCVDELKLETLDFHDRPHLVVASVQGYLRHGVPSSEEIEERKSAIRGDAEEKVRQRLGGVKRWIYFAILRWARRAVSDRERLRFERTRTFGVVRRLFRGVGRNLQRLGVLEHADDVFYLTVEELIAFSEGRAVTLNLGEIVRVRRAEFGEFERTAAPPDRFVVRGAVGGSFRHPGLLQSLDLLRGTEDDDPSVLRGTSCCPGVVEGPVRVARTFEDTQGLDGEILVTARTDPGWVPVFPACSGLIIERGSLLSHSAVVARELGIPTIVGVGGAPLERLVDGQQVRMDAGKGEVKIL